MELVYDNKLTKAEIFHKSAAIRKYINIPEDRSLLFKGDNFAVLSELLEKYCGKIDLIYIDPPYNTANDFMISGGRANSVSKCAEGIVAYSDKMDNEKYLEFLRERLYLLRELLSDKGSIYLHIDYKIGHYVKIIMDEVFGAENFKNDIARVKSNPKNFYRRAYGNEKDLILFYAKNHKKNIWNNITVALTEEEIAKKFTKTDENGKRYTTIPLHAPGETKNGITGKPWRDIAVPEGRHWRTDPKEFDRLDAENRIEWSASGNPRIKKYADEHKGKKIQDIWRYKDPQAPIYPTEKNSKMIERIIMQSSEKDSFVLDCFAGSGTALKCAHYLGRKWIGVDNSEAAIEVIMNSCLENYEYYDLNTDFHKSVYGALLE
ncbi:MAG: site-specific DNA-methyltransferase [Bacillota bacterium]|jgi:adenine-specific DNA-methyltransferase